MGFDFRDLVYLIFGVWLGWFFSAFQYCFNYGG